MKKILFIDHDEQISGSTISMMYLVKHFFSNGFKIFILTAKKPDLYNIFSDYDVTCLSAKVRTINPLHLNLTISNKSPTFSIRWFRSNLSIIRNLLLGMLVVFSTLRRVKPNIVYINEYVSLAASLISKMLGIPSVVHIRSPIIKGAIGIRRYLLSHAIVNFNSICFGITDFECKQLPQHKKNVFIAYEFIDDHNFKADSDKQMLRGKFGIPANSIAIVMLGGIARIKGTCDLLKAAELCIKKNNNIFIVIAGQMFPPLTEYENSCIAMLSSPAMNKNVKFLGSVPNAVDLISSCDILISTNTETHFSRPVIEAWALRKPVIVTNVEHSIELVNHMENGIIVKVHDFEEMAEAILRLVSDKKLAESIADAGYKKVKDDFTSKKTLNYIYEKCSDLI